MLRSRGARGAEDVRRLLSPAAGETHDPHLLLDMGAAARRIHRAIADGDRIAVYGDYDADGLTATTLLTSALEFMGADVRPFIPSRFEEGYGLQREALGRLRRDGVRLVVSVDCGVRALEEAAAAAADGLDLIVTDHHEPGDVLPTAAAVINPKREGDPYPFKELSGAGLAYKLAQALVGGRLGRWMEGEALVLVAVGTIADVAPLTAENRTLVARGLERLRSSPPAGVAALVEVAGLKPTRLTARDVGFLIAPRLNAVGRLASPEPALRLLRSASKGEARSIAAELDRANRERQDRTREVIEKARQRLLELPDLPPLLFDADEEYGEGILGPAAAKLAEEWNRPAVLVSIRGDIGRGSARSVPGFHITEALEACGSLLDRFGGHAAAAGFTVRARMIPELRARLEAVAREAIPTPDEAAPLTIDASVTPSDVDYRLLEFLDRLEPMGTGFPSPLFACLGMQVVAARPVGRDQAHLKLTVRHSGRTVDAIAFRSGEARPVPGEVVDLAFHVERDSYLGYETIRWNVQAIRPHQRKPQGD